MLIHVSKRVPWWHFKDWYRDRPHSDYHSKQRSFPAIIWKYVVMWSSAPGCYLSLWQWGRYCPVTHMTLTLTLTCSINVIIVYLSLHVTRDSHCVCIFFNSSCSGSGFFFYKICHYDDCWWSGEASLWIDIVLIRFNTQVLICCIDNRCLPTASQLSINLLGPNDAIWRQRSGSTLAQVMACCLTAPSHNLNQCWLIISKVLWHSSEGNFLRDTSATIPWS